MPLDPPRQESVLAEVGKQEVGQEKQRDDLEEDEGHGLPGDVRGPTTPDASDAESDHDHAVGE